jgi:isopenicillin-N N-acyltransferase like protein
MSTDTVPDRSLGRERTPAPLRRLRVGGSPKQRGLSIGRALKNEIAAHMADLHASLAGAAGGDVRGYLADMLGETDFKRAIHACAPDLLEEVEGIAEGSGLASDDIYALQLLDEEWAYRVRRASARELNKCSSLAIAEPGGPTWIGQNMDLGDYTDGHQVLLELEADGAAPAARVFSTAGMIGLMGVNAAGVGACVNSLSQLPNAAEGLPVAFVLRRLLQARTLDEASDLVQTLPHATNQHYVIATPQGVRSFEASAVAVTEYRPADPARVFHTNHPLTDAPLNPGVAGPWENSEARLASVTGRLSKGAPGLVEIEAALSAKDDPNHPVCRSFVGGGLFALTTGSMISALTPVRVDSWVSAGPPLDRGYHALGPMSA